MSKKDSKKANYAVSAKSSPEMVARNPASAAARHQQSAPWFSARPRIAARLSDSASVLVILLWGAYGMLSLPYAFPPHVEAPLSQSFAVGFNNRMATMSALVVIGLLCLRSFFWRQSRPEPVESMFYEADQQRLPSMPKSVLFLFIGIYLAIAVLLYWCIPYLEQYGESLFSLPRLELAARIHLQAYRDVEWPYGPALFYLPMCFIKVALGLGATADAGFLAFYCCELAAGLWVLFYVVDNLRIKTAYRVAMFSSLALAMLISPMTFAVQGTWVRYAAPYAALYAMRNISARIGPLKTWRAVAALCGTCLVCAWAVLSISPEIGIVYVIAQTAYCVHKAMFSQRSWLYAALATALSLPAMILAFPNYLLVFSEFASGIADFPIYPAAHVVLFLLSLFWIAPILLRGAATLQPSANTAFVLAWAILIVAMLPAALGRCDSFHVFSSGLGVFLMTFAALARFRPRLFSIYTVGFIAVYGVAMQIAVVISYTDHLQPVVMALSGRRVLPESQPSPLVDKLGLADYHAIATPLGVDRATREFLLDSGRFLPEFHLTPLTITVLPQMDRLVDDLRKADAILAPEWILSLKNLSDADIRRAREAQIEKRDEGTSRMLGFLFLYPVNFKTKHLAFDPWLLVARHVASNYEVARHEAGWVLMVPKTAPAGPSKAAVSVPPDQPRPYVPGAESDSSGMPTPEPPRRPAEGG